MFKNKSFYVLQHTNIINRRNPVKKQQNIIASFITSLIYMYLCKNAEKIAYGIYNV